MSYFDLNRVTLVARLTRDPELRALPSGTSVCGLRVACNSSRRNDDGTYTERPSYFDVSVYGASAEPVSRYMRRGSRVGIDGRLEWREWETDEQKRQAVSIVADAVQFLENANGGSEGRRENGSSGEEAGVDDRELVGVGVGADEELVF